MRLVKKYGNVLTILSQLLSKRKRSFDPRKFFPFHCSLDCLKAGTQFPDVGVGYVGEGTTRSEHWTLTYVLGRPPPMMLPRA
jgi:hypothetical protein